MSRKVTIGRCRIPEFLNARGWSQQDLVDRTGISKGTISAYCTEYRTRMHLLNAVLIADALGVEPRDLYEWVYVKAE
ncbi:helix-turn-helix domain-containing protein [Paenibacillus planticolens]|uniref:helix-turn-helix domain-containing protein n=1 Tax=Paenibacillus planticolens TaxID=2654976 RepID=UPI001492C9BC|nr:helix-turn-helix transcriptional regulator [Paenibacillus planticolens]